MVLGEYVGIPMNNIQFIMGLRYLKPVHTSPDAFVETIVTFTGLYSCLFVALAVRLASNKELGRTTKNNRQALHSPYSLHRPNSLYRHYRDEPFYGCWRQGAARDVYQPRPG